MSPRALRNKAIKENYVHVDEEFEKIWAHDVRHNVTLKVLVDYLKEQRERLTGQLDATNFEGSDWAAHVAAIVGERKAYLNVIKLISER